MKKLKIAIPKNVLTSQNNLPNPDTILIIAKAQLENPEFIRKWQSAPLSKAPVDYPGTSGFMASESRVIEILRIHAKSFIATQVLACYIAEIPDIDLSYQEICNWIRKNIGILFDSRRGVGVKLKRGKL